MKHERQQEVGTAIETVSKFLRVDSHGLPDNCSVAIREMVIAYMEFWLHRHQQSEVGLPAAAASPGKSSLRCAFLTLREAAQYLGYDEGWFRRIVKRGLVKHWQPEPNAPIKFKKEWLDEYVEMGTQGGIVPTNAARPRRGAKARPISGKTFGLDADLMP
jgi:hypothetical protein